MASSSSSINAQSPSLKTYFKTLEGRYKLQYEKSHPVGLLHYSHSKAVSQLTIAYLREKPAMQPASMPTTPSSGSGVRSAVARFLGTGNGSRALSFVGGNGVSWGASGSMRIGRSIGASTGSGSSLKFGVLVKEAHDELEFQTVMMFGDHRSKKQPGNLALIQQDFPIFLFS